MIAERIRKDQEYKQWLEDEKKKRIIKRCEDKVRDAVMKAKACKLHHHVLVLMAISPRLDRRCLWLDHGGVDSFVPSARRLRGE